MTAECFYYFFTCTKDVMSESFIGIRDWILMNQNEFRIADPKWKVNLRPFGQFITWIVDFLNSVGQISHNLKIALLLYFCKFHHGRYFLIDDPKSRNRIKNNILLLGDGMVGKSHVLKVIMYTVAAYDKAVKDIMHSTAGCNNVEGNYDGYLRVHDEFNSKMWMDSDQNQPEIREQFKNILTSHSSETISLVMEKLIDDDGNSYTKREQHTYKSSMQMNIMAASNNKQALSDSNVLTRFLVFMVPKTKTESDEGTAKNFKLNDSYNDIIFDKELYREHQILHAVLVLMEKMTQAGVFEEPNFGTEISGGESAIESILDYVQKNSGINTSNPRKRCNQLEIARSMALAFACWMGMVSPFTQYLFDHNDKHIGFNHRILNMGIMPWNFIASDQIAFVTQLLNFNFQETFLEEILEIFALKICRVLNSDDNSHCFYTDPTEHTIDYSYIYLRTNNLDELSRLIQSNFKDQVLSIENITSILIELTKRIKSIYKYCKKNLKDNYLSLLRDSNTLIPITEKLPVVKILDGGRGKRLVFISVSFLKELFPKQFNDKFVESDKENLLNLYRNGLEDHNDDEEEKRYSNNLQYDNCFLLNTYTNPFANGFKWYYENKYLGYIDKFFTNIEKKNFTELYTNKHKKLMPLRYLTPEPPKDYLLSLSDKLPNGYTNVVKLNKVLSVIELDFMNNKDENIQYNLQPYLPTAIDTILSERYIKRTDGTFKIMQINQEILDNNTTFIKKQICDHDLSSSKRILNRLKFPGYLSLTEDKKFFNWPIMTYHHLFQDFIRTDINDIKSKDDKLDYPEVNIRALVKNKTLLLKTEIDKYKKTNNNDIITYDSLNPSKKSIFNINSNINKKYINEPPNEILSIIKEKKKKEKNEMKKLQKKQQKGFENSVISTKTSSLKRNRKNSGDNTGPIKKKQKNT